MLFVPDIELYLSELIKTIKSLHIGQINAVIEKLIQIYRNNGCIYIFGNGGSAATASHFVCDFNKGVSENLNPKYKVICLNDNIPSVLAIANDYGYDLVFKHHLQNFLTANDMVMGISGSGNSENIIKAIDYANRKGAVTVGLTGCNGGQLKKCAQLYIQVPSFDMQKVEDLHLVLLHLMMQIVKRHLEKG